MEDDSAINGNHRLFLNGSPALAPGVVGNALFLSVPASYSVFTTFEGNDGFMTGAPGITVAGWINVSALPSPAIDVATIAMLSIFSNSNNSRFVLAINSAGQVEVGGRSLDSDMYQSKFTLATVGLNQWAHIAGVIDYPNDSIRIYLNGVEQALASGSVAFSQPASDTTTGQTFAIGSTGTTMEFFNGGVDEMMFYNETLSSGQIANLAAVPEPSSTALVLMAIATLWGARRRAG